MKTFKFWIAVLIIIVVIGFVSYFNTTDKSVLAGNETYSFSLPNGWQADGVGGAANSGNSHVQVFSGSGSAITGVSSLDQKSIDEMKSNFAQIYPGADIKSEPATIGGEKAVVVTILGKNDGQSFFWTASMVYHKEVLYTIIFNSTDFPSRATADFQKIKDSFTFK